MYCIKCQCDVVECQCPDIEERLESYYDVALGLAARQNIESKKVSWDNRATLNNSN